MVSRNIYTAGDTERPEFLKWLKDFWGCGLRVYFTVQGEILQDHVKYFTWEGQNMFMQMGLVILQMRDIYHNIYHLIV